VNIDKEKMSKSLGNFFTIRDVLKNVHPEVMRFFLLSHHYRSPVDYSDESLRDARAGLERLYGVMGRIEEILAGKEYPAEADPLLLNQLERNVLEAIRAVPAQFEAAMDDDFNTAEALGQFHIFARQVGGLIHKGIDPRPAVLALLGEALKNFNKMGSVLGILEKPAAEYFAAQHAEALAAKAIDTDEIDRLVAERLEARKQKDWKRADEIRAILDAKHIAIEDGPGGSTWKVKKD
jgi:cysteinyl-tRNA synthetase